MKNSSAAMVIVLTVTTVVVGGILAGFFHLVYPRIEANRIAEEKRAIFAVLQGAEKYDVIEKEITGAKGKKEVVRIFKGLNAAGETVGYAFIAEGPGFQGTIKMMVGLNIDLKKLTAMKVLEQVETPGLGNKISEARFTDQFSGLLIEPRIEYLKNRKPEKPNEIQAVTGATISSKAVVNGLNGRINIILGILVAEAKPKEG
ncbi:MAG: RnfABCDGE type electron transport complex subunit G [Deltaproteobacteria bacterium]|nr:RnfABCDGE type electron transport complex subunit G [Deltaproteobacteria bacterium]